MRSRIHRFRFRRTLRFTLQAVADAIHIAGEFFERNFFSRLYKLPAVWRPIAGWLLLFVLIIGSIVAQIVNLRSYYQTLQPVPGGMYTEGMNGLFTTANPLYAVSDVDTSVSRLLFASLLTYDSNNQLVGDLAQSWSVNSQGTVYTVRLRPNLVWQDGKPLTAADVLFTYQTIQDSNAQSPLYTSWQGVTVAAPDDNTVSFTLPNPLASFPYSLTNGIIPKHILGTIAPADLRSASFNTANPIGAGPFRWESIGVTGLGDTTESQISLVPFKQYWAGEPKLTRFTLYAYADQQALQKAFKNKDILAMVVPGGQLANTAITAQRTYTMPVTAGVYVFFKTNQSNLSDAKVRQALVAAADRPAIIKALGYDDVIPVDEPLLKAQLGYDRSFIQQTAQPDTARKLLDDDGWRQGPKGLRAKDGKLLTFTLLASNTPENQKVTQLLVQQWRSVGIGASVSLQQPEDFQGSLSNFANGDDDAVLTGIAIGVDPDVFVYWDSSQADPRSPSRLNFAQYKSKTADLSLEAARTRLDPQLRIAKYRTFLQAWQQDTPALGLYQPSLLYATHTQVFGLSDTPINTDADRFNNVQNWMIHQEWVTR